MIFESNGGVSAEAKRALISLNKAVAVNSDASEVVVATRFWQGRGVDILWGSYRSFQRRLVTRGKFGYSCGLCRVLAGLHVAAGA